MRLCFDSVTAADIPAGSELVAGYCDGRYRWSDADWALHAGKVLVRIAVNPNTHEGQVLDVESGAAGPNDAPFWVHHRRLAGIDPTCYVNLSNWQATREAFLASGEPEPHWWLALYDNVKSIPIGAVAKQYADEDMTGGHYDASIVADFWPGIDPEEDGMTDAEFKAAYQRLIAPDLEAEIQQRKQEAIEEAVKAVAAKLAQ